MNPTAKAIAIFCLFASPLAAQADCSFEPGSPNNCIRFVGCIGEDGTHFHGISIGWGSGTVQGRTSDGESCQGTWEAARNNRRGEGYLNCGPTETAKFKFFSRGKDLQILSGVAVSSEGRRMVTWAGNDLEGYLKDRFPNGPHPGFQCGQTWVAMPTEFPDYPEKSGANE